MIIGPEKKVNIQPNTKRSTDIKTISCIRWKDLFSQCYLLGHFSEDILAFCMSFFQVWTCNMRCRRWRHCWQQLFLPSCPLQVGGSGKKDTKAHGAHIANTETWFWRENVIKGAHLLYLVQSLWEKVACSEQCFWQTTFDYVKGRVVKVQRKKPFEGHTKRTLALPC